MRVFDDGGALCVVFWTGHRDYWQGCAYSGQTGCRTYAILDHGGLSSLGQIMGIRPTTKGNTPLFPMQCWIDYPLWGAAQRTAPWSPDRPQNKPAAPGGRPAISQTRGTRVCSRYSSRRSMILDHWSLDLWVERSSLAPTSAG